MQGGMGNVGTFMTCCIAVNMKMQKYTHTKKEEKVLKREEVLCKELEGEGILFNPQNEAVHVLNKTALAIWKLCDGKFDVQEIATEIATTFEGDECDIFNDVRKCIADFRKQQLLK